MAFFVTNCCEDLGGCGGHSSFVKQQRLFSKIIFSCKYIKVELLQSNAVSVCMCPPLF